MRTLFPFPFVYTVSSRVDASRPPNLFIIIAPGPPSRHSGAEDDSQTACELRGREWVYVYLRDVPRGAHPRAPLETRPPSSSFLLSYPMQHR